MGRLTKNHMLEISAVVTIVGLALTSVSFAAWKWNLPALQGYESLVEGGWNGWILVISPFILLTGAWYFGEQIYMRRKFDRLLETEKKSEFSRRVRDLEDLARRLPKEYEGRIEQKQATFKSHR